MGNRTSGISYEPFENAYKWNSYQLRPYQWGTPCMYFWFECRTVASTDTCYYSDFLFFKVSNTMHTTQNSQNKWTKISDLETTIFDLNMMVKSGLVFFLF